MQATNRVFRLHPGEFPLILILGLVLLVNSLTMQLGGIVAVSGFLNTGGINSILIVYLVDYALIFLSGGFQSLIVDRFDRTKLVKAMALLFALVYLVLRLLFLWGAPDWLNYAITFVFAEQQFVFFPLVFWVLANDLYSMEQSKRLFPLISSLSFVGELIGIGLAIAAPAIMLAINVSIEEVLTLNALLYLGAWLALHFGLRNMKPRITVRQKQTLRETLVEGWDFVRNVDSFRYLMYVVVALAACWLMLEFRFLAITNQAYPDQFSYQRFFSIFRLALALGGFAMQVLFTGRLLAAMDLRRAFFVLPVAALVAAVLMMVAPGAVPVIAGIGIYMLARLTVHDSAMKSLESLIPEERRGRASTFIDGYLPAVGVIGGVLLTGAIVLIGHWMKTDLNWLYLIMAALAAMLSILWIYKMQKVYDNSLLNWRLKRRRTTATNVMDKLDF
ncbi:MAG TPA: Npt1/Npt2 family nucleotide transporter [Anaerolineaceae bacterium]|jgi:ATP/ADP translocase|nr:Npt1/Npt2 family nucleotide transporter [Anaerolineaceae bacterium]